MNTSEFKLNLAVVIGINDYRNGVPTLGTARQDAEAIAEILETKYDYQVHLITDTTDTQATSKNLKSWLETELPEVLKKVNPSRLLFYFAGHGIALNGDDGPQGYLIPQDAKLGEVSTYLPMQMVEAALTKLSCRHCLVILDCCFAGAFRWSSTRKLVSITETIHKERYDRFIQDPAWQVITSAASDQYANDSLDIKGDRGIAKNNTKHSPFAAALMEALSGKADAYPVSTNGKPSGDGVITATELYLYLRDAVEPSTEEHHQRQTPGIWPLKNHDKGEYIFLAPGHPLNLPPAPPLDESKNPYRGLESFCEEHSALFFGRTTAIAKLYEFVSSHTLTIVLGASGSGKSSLVKAGLVPLLKQQLEVKSNPQWQILAPFRPGESPLKALNNTLAQEKLAGASITQLGIEEKVASLSSHLADWSQQHPNKKMVLVIDQFEELITLCKDERERENFLTLLAQVVAQYPKQLRLVLTLRSDFEPQFRDTALKDDWNDSRFVVSQMTRTDLREAIEKPAEKRVMYFEPHELVEQLIDEVADMPGALPLLSFGLSELYLKYLRRQRDAQTSGETIDRSLTQADYQDLGGVIQSLTQRADEEYEALVKENPAYAQVIHQVMLRMVAIGGGELARRQVPLSELVYPTEKNGLVKEVIERFTNARLLVKGEDPEGKSYVEPAHDALVRGWQKLLAWKQEDEESLILQRRLTPAAEEWKGQEKVKFLWNANPRLDLLKKVLDSEVNWLNKVETDFIRRSIRRKSFNTRRNWSIAIAVMLGLSGLTIFALNRQRSAEIQAIRASIESSEALMASNQMLDARIASLRAGTGFKELSWQAIWPEEQLKNQVRANLQRVVYEGQVTNRLEAHRGKVSNVAFSPNGQRIVTSGDVDATVRLWDTSGKMLHEFKGETSGFKHVMFTSDNKHILALDGDGIVRLWDTSGNLLHKFDVPGSSSEMAFSPDGQQIVSLEDDGFLSLRDTSGKLLRKFKAYKEKERSYSWSVAFSPDGRQIAIGTAGKGSIYLWDVSTGKLLHEFTDFKNCFTTFKLTRGDVFCVTKVVFSPDGQQIAAMGAADSIIFVWDISGKLLAKFRGDESDFKNIVFSPVFSPDGQQIAIVHRNNNISLSKIKKDQTWTENNILSNDFEGDKGLNITSVAFTPDGRHIAIGGEDGSVHLWDTVGQPLIGPQKLDSKQCEKFSNLVAMVRFSPDGRQIATGTEDSSVCLWDTSGRLLNKFDGFKGDFNSVGFDHNNKLLVALGKSLAVDRLVNSSGNVAVNFKNLDSRTDTPASKCNIYSFAFSRDGQRIVTGGSHNDICVWDAFGNFLSKFDGALSEISSIAFSPNGQQIVTGGVEGNARLWDISGRLLNQLAKGQLAVAGVAFSPDGQQIATGGGLSGQNVLLSDTSGKQLAKFNFRDVVPSVAFSQDGLEIATNADGNILLWRVDGNIDRLFSMNCDWVRDYLKNNPKVSESDKHLCDDVKPLPEQTQKIIK